MEKRILIAFVIGLSHIALVWATPQKNLNSLDKSTATDPTKAKIMKQINKVNDDGSYTFGYESDDGSFRVETRNKDGVVKGKYGFVDPGTGELKVTEYTAGEKAVAASEPQSDEYPENNYRVTPTRQSSSSDQSTSAQTPSAKKVARPSPNNSFDDEIDVDDGPKQPQYKFPTGTPAGPAPVAPSGDDEDFRSFGNGAQQAYQQRRQIESRQGELPRGQGPAGQPPGPPQFFSPQDARQFGGERPRYIPTNDFNDFQDIPQGVRQSPYQGGPSPFGGNSQQFPQGFNAGPQQFNTPVLRSPQQSPQGQGQGQFEIQPHGFGRPQQPQSIRGSPEELSPFNGGRFEEPQQRLSFGAGPGQGPSPFANGFDSVSPNGRQFAAGPASRGQQFAQQQPNYELDGFSEDADQDGFVDPPPGGLGGKSAQAAEKQGVVKTPEGERIGTTSGDYSPQALGPASQFLQGGRVSIRPGQGQISPYNPQGQLSPEQIQQIYNQPQFQGGRPSFPLSQFSPQQQSSGGPGQIPQQFLQQGPQFLGQQGGAYPTQQAPSQFGQQFSPQFQGGGLQGRGPIPQNYPQQFGGFGGPAPQQQQIQFSPQSGQQGGIPPQFLQGGQGQQNIPPQFLQQGLQGQGSRPEFSNRSPSGNPIQSGGFPFDFGPYQAGPGGAPSAIPVQPGTQSNRLGGLGQGQQQAFFPGGQPSFGGQGFPGGVPLSGQQIPQQFVPQNFQGRQGAAFEGSPASKESGEGAKTT